MWAENLMAGHTSTASSISQAIQQMQQDWDQSQGVQTNPSFEGQAVGDVLAVSEAADLGLLVLDTSAHVTGI